MEAIKVSSASDGITYANKSGYPVVVRPLFALQYRGYGTATDEKSLYVLLEKSLKLSPVHEVFVETLS